MRLFKAKESERSEEDEAAAMRLSAIRNRIRPASPSDSDEPATPKEQEPEEPGDPQ
jgi:hypothetical protein